MWQTLISLCLALSGQTPRRRAPRRRPAFRRPLRPAPRLEALEDRTVLSPYLVTTTADSGPGSLRDAINVIKADVNPDGSSKLSYTNADPTRDEIDFNITADSNAAGYPAGQAKHYNATTGVATIAPLSALPAITNAVFIDGYTQGYNPDGTPTPLAATPNRLLGTSALGSMDSTLHPNNYGDNAVLKIELDGENAGTAAGLALAASNITVQGLAINRFANDGIYVSGNADVIQGNFLGTDVTGTQALGNHGSDVYVDWSGGNDTIGGRTTAARNIISGALPATSGPYVYGDGIFMIGNDQLAVIQGNFIGTDVTGRKALGNTNWGIASQSNHDLIGGTDAGAGNLISGNADNFVSNSGGHGGILSQGGEIVCEGNFIGTDVTGTSITYGEANSLGNGIGIFCEYGGGVIIGGTTESINPLATGSLTGNLISGNGTGIRFDSPGNQAQGNLIGTDVTGQAPLRQNAGQNPGIDIQADGNTIGGTDAEDRNIISGGENGFYVAGSRNVIQGNFIGTNIDGNKAFGGEYTGVVITGADNTLGGTSPGARNVISGWQYGEGAVVLNEGATGNKVEGNYIGTDATGEVPLGNGTGVLVSYVASGNTITGNVISGCGDGVLIDSQGQSASLTSGNVVQGNQIGTDATGTQILGNVSFGVEIRSSQGTQVTDNVIVGTRGVGDNYHGAGVLLTGGTSGNAISDNTIGSNAVNGVAVISGTGNSILGNSIHDNGGLGIYLASGAKDNQAAPVLTSAITSATGTAITGTLANYPNSSFRIEFFTNPPGVSSEGQTFLGFATVTTDANGYLASSPDGSAVITNPGTAAASFTASLPTLPPGTSLTATATVATPNGDGTYTYGDTSEFAANTTVKGALSVAAYSNLMLAGSNPPSLAGSVNGTPFAGSTTYTTAFGDQITVTLGTTATSASPVGQYAITASLSGPNAANYFIDPATSTTGTMYVVSVGPDPSSTTGAQAVTFWDNNHNAKLITAADLSALDGLNLVDQHGNPFDPKSVSSLRQWLAISPNATAAYQLSVQLAATDLNVLTGYVKGTDLVYAGALLPYASAYGLTGLTSGGFIDVQALMNAANSVLGLVQPGAADPNQAYELALAQVLQAANGNSDFVRQELSWNLLGLYLSLI
jgi:titin